MAEIDSAALLHIHTDMSGCKIISNRPHGTNDFIVDIKYSEQAVEKYPSAVLYPIQGASHGFNNANLNGMASFVGGEKDDVVMPYVLRFLEEHI